jgi:hypothetical protein
MSTATNLNADPLVIHVGRQSDGYAYELHPRSRRRIEARFPGAHLMSSLFVGVDNRSSLQQQEGAVLRQVATLLTGLTPEQLDELGGVVLYDPATDTRSPLALAS